MWLIATTITLFIANVRVMADKYSVTTVQSQPLTAQCHTAVTSLHTRRYSSYEPQISPVHLHSNTVYCHSVTASVGTDRTKCTVQQPFTVPTDSVQWKVQWTLCGVGATD